MHDQAVDYHTHPGIPGEYFKCDRLRAEFSIDSCAKRWQSQQGKDSIGLACHRCPIGAQHANRAITHTQYQRRVCVRCHQHAQKLVKNLLCVSCYNRQQEVLKGQDRRGKPPNPYERLGVIDPKPKKLVAIHTITLCLLPPGATTPETFTYRGADRQEAILAAMRQYPQPPVIIGARPIPSGHDMFGGYHRFTR